MNEVHVFHATRYGQTALIASRIADVIRESGIAVKEYEITRHNWRTLLLPRYAGLILGAPIYRGQFPKEFLNFVTQNRDALKGPADAFFCVCMEAAGRDEISAGQVESYFHKLSDETHWIPSRRTAFAGSVKYREYNFLVRYVMKRIMRSKGLSTDTTRDHEYTDWQAVNKFAREYAASAAGRTAAGSRPLQAVS